MACVTVRIKSARVCNITYSVAIEAQTSNNQVTQKIIFVIRVVSHWRENRANSSHESVASVWDGPYAHLYSNYTGILCVL